MQDKLKEHIKRIAHLEEYILNAPASQIEHQRALSLLNSIIEYYVEKNNELENKMKLNQQHNE